MAGKTSRLRILSVSHHLSAVTYYRTTIPGRALRAAGHFVRHWEDKTFQRIAKPSPAEWLKRQVDKFDVFITDRVWEWEDLGLFMGWRHLTSKKPGRLICDFDDDFLQVPKWNSAHGRYQPGQETREAGKAHLKAAEVVTVSTEALVESFAPLCHKVIHSPNVLDPADWEPWPQSPERALDPHLRVLYGGAAGHYGDLDEAREGIERLIENPPVPWRLICFGAIPQWVHEAARRYPDRVVRIPWVKFEDYPKVVAWGGFDAAIAPLAEHPFNTAKSNIKWLEAGIQRIPFLASKVGPYADIPEGCGVLVENRPDQWAEGLNALLTDSSLRERMKESAYQAVRDSYPLDKVGERWESILQEALEAPRLDSLEAMLLPSEREELASAQPVEHP